MDRDGRSADRSEIARHNELQPLSIASYAWQNRARMPANSVILIGRIDFRNSRQRFGIRDADRFSHIYIIGKTGTGKPMRQRPHIKFVTSSRFDTENAQ